MYSWTTTKEELGMLETLQRAYDAIPSFEKYDYAKMKIAVDFDTLMLFRSYCHKLIALVPRAKQITSYIFMGVPVILKFDLN